jgi:ParB-like nuclease domain
MKPLTIEPMAVARLQPFPGNARAHSKKQIRQIADSIAKFGFTNPILIDDDNKIIAGHGRLEAAKLLGLKGVPTLRLSGLDAAQRRAYALADNKLALNAGWNRGALAVELRALADLQFDAEVTGFSCAELELVLDGAPERRRTSDSKTPRGKRSNAHEEVPPSIPDAAPVSSPSPACEGGLGRGRSPRVRAVEQSPSLPSPASGGNPRLAAAAVTRSADLWLIERHRLLCADARDLAPIDRMLDGERLVFVTFEPALCDRIVNHFRQLTGQDATLAASGQSFADVAAQRKDSSMIK